MIDPPTEKQSRRKQRSEVELPSGSDHACAIWLSALSNGVEVCCFFRDCEAQRAYVDSLGGSLIAATAPQLCFSLCVHHFEMLFSELQAGARFAWRVIEDALNDHEEDEGFEINERGEVTQADGERRITYACTTAGCPVTAVFSGTSDLKKWCVRIARVSLT